MVGRIYHVGLVVSDLERSIHFYRDVLGLHFQDEIFMEGEATEKIFGHANCSARVAYLNGDDNNKMPPIELIEFQNPRVKSNNAGDLFSTSIAEVCFYTDHIDEIYHTLIAHQVVCLSEPQYFDFSDQRIGKSKAIYFKHPDGIILEMMQPL